ncbi:MAG: hypothetical protein EBS06_06365 [Proteobacteria bacterium]|nr:hypothetical protein [Pseudomonadota bacterium]
MFFDVRLFLLALFILIGFSAIFFIKNRTTTVTTLIISHLILVIFLSLSISNYSSFKELVLAVIAYSMLLLFLISNENQIFLNKEIKLENKSLKRVFIFSFSVFMIILPIFLALFLVTKNIPQIAKKISEQKFERQNEVMLNPMTSASHAVHIEVRKSYLGKKIISDNDDLFGKINIENKISAKKQERFHAKLANSFLLKRSHDVILIIVAISTTLLLLAARKTKNNS